MNWLIVAVVIIAVVVLVSLAATNPMMRKREDAAIKTVKDALGPVELIEPRTTAMGTEPDDGSGLRGMVCLGLSKSEVMAVAWVGGGTWRVDRTSVTSVDTPADELETAARTTINITYDRPGDDEATAMFRVRDASDWLTFLGYDWGAEGPPSADEL